MMQTLDPLKLIDPCLIGQMVLLSGKAAVPGVCQVRSQHPRAMDEAGSTKQLPRGRQTAPLSTEEAARVTRMCAPGARARGCDGE